ncbi:hypothetical protein P5E39_12810 [Clostridium perfringens]|uniref:hypothetical protein n=1 Tax=Clostridium perfringens TaxID=1502 RepID=UPI0034A3DEB5|nr:hypothetical protein [Clostridium perfringens]MDK0834986.1 hypothetical protein [Clostridium perfringens]MDM0781022.1 hypothetical protein [Clostridium perfringens]
MEDIKAPEEKVETKEETTTDKKVETKEESKAEEVKVEDKKAPEEKKVDVEALQKELEEASKKAKEFEVLNSEVETLKKSISDKDAELKEYEELVGNMVEAKMKNVPEELKDLIPENMSLKQKLSWLDKAESKGLFNKEAKKKPAVEVGKPMNTETPAVDTSKMSPAQLLKMAYSSPKK